MVLLSICVWTCVSDKIVPALLVLFQVHVCAVRENGALHRTTVARAALRALLLPPHCPCLFIICFVYTCQW